MQHANLPTYIDKNFFAELKKLKKGPLEGPRRLTRMGRGEMYGRFPRPMRVGLFPDW